MGRPFLQDSQKEFILDGHQSNIQWEYFSKHQELMHLYKVLLMKLIEELCYKISPRYV